MSLSSMMEWWDTFAYIGYDLLADVKFLLQYPKYKKYLKRNKALKDQYQGKKCFIVLNGPSLNEIDISRLTDEYVFCVNYMYRSEKIETLNPDFYCWSDGKVFQSSEAKEVTKELYEKTPNAKYFFNMKYLQYSCELEDRVHVTYSKHMPHRKKVRNNLAGNSSNFMNVAVYAVNVALYLGFSEIYIVGYDFTPGVMKHFADLGSNNANPNLKEKKDEVCGLHWGYVAAQYQNYYIAELARKKNAKIYNVNKDSYVRAFEFVDFDKVFL